MSQEPLIDDYAEMDDELSESLLAQLENFEARHSLQLDVSARRKNEKLRIRRQIEEWSDIRRRREETDYLH
ncbi:MAG: hypothetical protein V2I41_10680 [Pseudomonadales bacterium]|jgi:hypothetical protein|nr:hypothetical protein [Pseudomonadales bacterium]